MAAAAGAGGAERGKPSLCGKGRKAGGGRPPRRSQATVGSCTSGGRIAYSWRLVMAPPWVRQSVVAHEVAHLVHLNHPPAFHALHRKLLGSSPSCARA